MARARLLAPILALAAAALLLAARPQGDEKEGPASLAGQFLIAAPDMGDPRFAETVILMVHHDETGAFGIVINRPVETRSLASLLEALGDKDPSAKGDVQIYAGGPVEPAIGFVVHSAEYRRAGTLAIDGQVAVTSNPEVLRDMGAGKGPAQSLVAFGYAGWGPGQLENELAQHAWFTEPEDPKLVFDPDRADLWKKALDRRDRAL
ncbi:MAG TPA: YqgE/AlgH family protein [Stellaceae bacterium]|nr:YqgE/AlgH family protein [Stellaceae bacterium]